MIAVNFEDGALTKEEYGGASRYAHGYFFNPAGTIAIGTSYWYEGALGLFRFDDEDEALPTGAEELVLRFRGRMRGGTCGAYVHYATWLNNRYAYVATMQQGKTPQSTCKISGPGVYLIDAERKITKRVAGTARDAFAAGVWNSGSDAVVANGKLYVSEERTLDGDYPFPPSENSVGSVGIFRIRMNRSLRWMKRIRPGSDGMPEDFGVGHGSSVATVDGREYVFVGSYASGHIIKIDTHTDEVVKVWSGGEDGLNAPHGGFVAGSIR